MKVKLWLAIIFAGLLVLGGVVVLNAAKDSNGGYSVTDGGY